MKTDSYLLHNFRIIEQDFTPPNGFRDKNTSERIDVRLPMLLRVTEAWSSDVPDLRVTSQLGNIVACHGTRRSLDVLESDPAVLSIEASRPSSGPELTTSLPFINAIAVHRPPIAETGDRSIVALIDHGIDVLHEAFRDSFGGSRILALWDQTDPTGPPPAVLGLKSTIGTLHTQTDIDRYIQNGSVGKSLGRDAGGHGTHVASIAAGAPTRGNFTGGVAPDSKLLVVLPKLQVGPTDPFSTGYSNGHIDALTFIKATALQHALPVVVNVSLGMNAGAHDGSSALEAGFDNFTGGGREPGFIIVKSAGNERGKNGHARVKIASNAMETLKWNNRLLHQAPDHIELWWSSADHLEFELRNPTAVSGPIVNVSNPSQQGTFPNGVPYEMTYSHRYSDNGDSRLLISLSPGQSAGIAAGTWELDIRSGVIRSQGEIHAWIEKAGGPHLIEFVTHQDDENTLSIPATARTVIAVGSVGPQTPFVLERSSSYGPSRDGREKPELAAPGRNIGAAQAGTGNGVGSRSGTSMAAPHVAGAIALLLSHCEKSAHKPNVNAAQVLKAITQTTQNYNGRHQPGFGYGVLDVKALLESFP